MKSAIITKTYKLQFNEVYEIIREKITSEGFLILHEINTQKIVSNYDIKINSLKQILFFHPRFIEKIVAQDFLAINEIPIKIVIHELNNGDVSVSCPNPVENLKDYNLSSEIGNELLQVINKII